jgi:hypothetical protein
VVLAGIEEWVKNKNLLPGLLKGILISLAIAGLIFSGCLYLPS